MNPFTCSITDTLLDHRHVGGVRPEIHREPIPAEPQKRGEQHESKNGENLGHGGHQVQKRRLADSSGQAEENEPSQK